MAGTAGLFFSDFDSTPAWEESSLPYDEDQLAEQVYDASRALTRAPVSEWAKDIGAAMRARLTAPQRGTAAIR